MNRKNLLWMGLLLLGAVTAMALAQEVKPLCVLPQEDLPWFKRLLVWIPPLILCLELVLLAQRLYVQTRITRILPGIYLVVALSYGLLPLLAWNPSPEYCALQYRAVSAGVMILALGLLEYRYRHAGPGELAEEQKLLPR